MSREIKIVQINTVANNSTGRIMHDIQRALDASGISSLAIIGRRKTYDDVPCVKYGSFVSFGFHVLLTTLFDLHGRGSLVYTKKIVDRIKKEKPDIIHLHNIHGYYINIPILMRYLSEEFKGKTLWTFHDLWPITGHCAFFSAASCDKWKTQCYKCANKKVYPISLFKDNSRENYLLKKSLFHGLNKLTIAVPSEWMKAQVDDSFLFDKKITIVHNGVDFSIFDYNRSDININNVCKKYRIDSQKKILLSVANIWDKRKGLSDVINLAQNVPDDYLVVIVGVTKRQIKLLPNNAVGINRTDNIDELVTFYSMASIFINPSVEESFSLVTVEAQACGTPCIVLDTSAVANLVNENNGIILHSHETRDYLTAIKRIEAMNLSNETVRNSAKNYSNSKMLENYMNLYKELLGQNE